MRDADPRMGSPAEEVGFELRLELVFAGLAWPRYMGTRKRRKEREKRERGGRILIEAGDGAGAGKVVEVLELEFAGVETVFEGIGAAGLPARATRGGHGRDPFGTRSEEYR